MDLWYLFLIAAGAVSAISTWIEGIGLRRRIKRALGEKASDIELTSLNIWMRVEDAEEKSRGASCRKGFPDEGDFFDVHNDLL